MFFDVVSLERGQPYAWWRHRMETFSVLLALCAGNSPVTGEFPAQRPVTRSFAVFFDLRLNKPLSKLSRGWWFETQSRPLWHHFNGLPGENKVTLKYMGESIKSYDAGHGIFRLWGSTLCLLMLSLLKSPEYQQVWYWLCRTDGMLLCPS